MSAFIVSNRNIVIPSPDGKTSCRLAKGYMGPVPDWVPETAYFKALVADGKIVLSQSKKDKDLRKKQSAAEKARKAAEKEAAEAARKAAEAAEDPESEEPQDDPGE